MQGYLRNSQQRPNEGTCDHLLLLWYHPLTNIRAAATLLTHLTMTPLTYHIKNWVTICWHISHLQIWELSHLLTNMEAVPLAYKPLLLWSAHIPTFPLPFAVAPSTYQSLSCPLQRPAHLYRHLGCSMQWPCSITDIWPTICSDVANLTTFGLVFVGISLTYRY